LDQMMLYDVYTAGGSLPGIKGVDCVAGFLQNFDE